MCENPSCGKTSGGCPNPNCQNNFMTKFSSMPHIDDILSRAGFKEQDEDIFELLDKMAGVLSICSLVGDILEEGVYPFMSEKDLEKIYSVCQHELNKIVIKILGKYEQETNE